MGFRLSCGNLFVFASLLLLILSSPLVSRTQAASQSDFGGAQSVVQSAFSAVQNADRLGGNVTALVAQLNGALSLIQKASAENATNPAQAAKDLANATSVAQKVASAAGPVGQQGSAARQLQFYLSVGSAAVIVAVASLIYIFGDRIYRRLWLRAYGSYEVRKIG